jgi:FtsH-binding integral membrane protein
MIVPQRPGQTPNMPNLGRTQARIVWFALALLFAAAQVAAFVGASSLGAVPNAALSEILLPVACVVVVADIGVGFFVASRIRKNASPLAPPDGIAATQVIVGSASALSGGLVCAVFFFLTQQALLLLLAAPAALALLWWFPSEGRWAALRPAQATGEPRRNPMVR